MTKKTPTIADEDIGKLTIKKITPVNDDATISDMQQWCKQNNKKCILEIIPNGNLGIKILNPTLQDLNITVL